MFDVLHGGDRNDKVSQHIYWLPHTLPNTSPVAKTPSAQFIAASILAYSGRYTRAPHPTKFRGVTMVKNSTTILDIRTYRRA
ncbi:hypothetical protein [Rhizobium halophytocola]|uniref:Uncharacterized protein n=1 Tax=Rhizobium halophytocola TaxID=735519 RepID=A0ABS4E5W3_9HYPH|nr:hypothetical protein [Rhizobium halophytocola]MBP1853307.1 hypothetical protein [Rhizobium halophytocola]